MKPLAWFVIVAAFVAGLVVADRIAKRETRRVCLAAYASARTTGDSLRVGMAKIDCIEVLFSARQEERP